MDPRIKTLVDNRLAEMISSGFMKYPIVPNDMSAGPEDDEGWTPWKAISSTITYEEISALQDEIGYKLPDLFVDLLLYKHFLELNFDQIRFLPLPSNEGICAIRRWVFSQSETLDWLRSGYIIFALSTDDESYYCFSARQPQHYDNSSRLDYPVVLRDPTNEGNQNDVTVFNSFSELVDSLIGH